MTSFDTNSTATELWREFFRLLGLDEFTVELMKNRGPGGYEYALILTKAFDARDVDVCDGPADYYRQLVKPLADKVTGSPQVKSMLEGVEKDRDAALDRVAVLEAKLRELEKYRAHYELELVAKTGSGEAVAAARDLVGR